MRRLALLTVLAAARLAWAATPYKACDEVAEVTLSMADGTEKKLSSYEGTTVLLFFYGTWERRSGDDAIRRRVRLRRDGERGGGGDFRREGRKSRAAG